jgi:glycosyltransferase involved in cell wall biosynthesis
MHDSGHKRIARVGVIIPTRNRVHCLPAALNSVLKQTWSDLEVLVVDDASTDGTTAYLAGVSDSRVRLLRLDLPHGAGGARNAGLKAMKNEWIAFQDSDDQWLPDKLEKQMAAADDETGFVYCRCRRSSGEATCLFPPPHVARLSGRIFEAMLGGNLVTTQTALVRRACIDAHGLFDETLPALEDWELFLRLSRDVGVAFVDEVLVEAPFSPDSISKRDREVIAAFEAILIRYADDFAVRPALHARHLGTIADRLCLSGRWPEGRAHFARAFGLDPRHVGHALGWVLAGWPSVYRQMRTRCGGRSAID